MKKIRLSLKKSELRALLLSIFLAFILGHSSFGQKKIPIYQAVDSSIKAKVNTVFIIQLKSLIGAGYSWVFTDSVDKRKLVLQKTNYIQPRTTKGGSTQGPVVRYYFKALSTGVTFIKLAEARPWEKNIAAAQRAIFKITIQ